MSPLDPSLGDVLERLIDAIDLSASKQHEIVEGLVSEGITTWQSFIFMEEENLQSIAMLSQTSVKLLLYLKDLVMINIEKGLKNADLPATYTKEMYSEYVKQIRLENWKKWKRKPKRSIPYAISCLSKSTVSSSSMEINYNAAGRKRSIRADEVVVSSRKRSIDRADEIPASKKRNKNVGGKRQDIKPRAVKQSRIPTPSEPPDRSSPTKPDASVDSSGRKGIKPRAMKQSRIPTPSEPPDRSSPTKPDASVDSSGRKWHWLLPPESKPPDREKSESTIEKSTLGALSDSDSEPDRDTKTIRSKTKPQKNATRAKRIDQIDVLESFVPVSDSSDRTDIHTLILGTMPSTKSLGNNRSEKEFLLRGGDGFWNIMGSALGFQRHQTSFEDQVGALAAHGYVVWNVLSHAKRKKGKSNDSNPLGGSFVPSDIPKFLLDHPRVKRIVFVGKSAERFCKGNVWGGWLKTGKAYTMERTKRVMSTDFWIKGSKQNPETFARTNAVFGANGLVRTIDDDIEYFNGDIDWPHMTELIVMPSTSPASTTLRPPEKEKIWHKACFGLQEPPESYKCPGCELHFSQTTSGDKHQETIQKRHWFQDSPYREEWLLFKKQQSKTKSDVIDPFDWYV